MVVTCYNDYSESNKDIWSNGLVLRPNSCVFSFILLCQVTVKIREII